MIDVDRTKWVEGPAGVFTNIENPTGATGAEVAGSGDLGTSDLGYWEWNLPLPRPWRQIPPGSWATFDLLVSGGGRPTGIAENVKWVQVHMLEIITDGQVPGTYEMTGAWRKYGSLVNNFSRWCDEIVGARLPTTVIVPAGRLVAGEAKIQYGYTAYGPTLAPHDGSPSSGASYGGHLFVMQWGR